MKSALCGDIVPAGENIYWTFSGLEKL